VTLPFFETLVFNAHVSTGTRVLALDTYVRLTAFFFILWASMCLVFLAEKHHVSKAWACTTNAGSTRYQASW
jgi:hypothetical protein